MSKSIERRNNNRRDKNDFQKRNDNYNNISNKLSYVIDYELSESICNILNMPKTDFINSVTTKIKNFLLSEYSKNTINEEFLKNLLIYNKEQLEKKYTDYFNILKPAWDNFLSNKNKLYSDELEKCYLKNYVYHCSFVSKYALHDCDENGKELGKFIKVYDNEKNQVKYVICENCKKVYFIEYFLNFCEKCQINYYCNELNSALNDLLPATLKKPHCEPVINEQIYCLYCKHILYLNIKTNQIKCLNCRFISNPKKMDWKCNLCLKKFKSDVIVFNKSEINYIKKIINYGLLMKKRAYPSNLPCCQNIDVRAATFYHKKECKGILYFTEFNKRLIIICEKCKDVNYFERFVWTCPECSFRFKDIKWKENELKFKKELSNKNEIKPNLNINFNNTITSWNNKRNIREFIIGNEKNSQDKDKEKNFRKNEISENKYKFNKSLSQQKQKTINEPKESNIEYKDYRNNNNEKSIPNVIKVKKNYFFPYNHKKESDNILISKKYNISENKTSIENEDKSFERKNSQKRCIIEKIIKKELNSQELSEAISKANHSEKNIHKNNNRLSDKIESNNKNIINSTDSKKVIIQNIQTKNNFSKVPITVRFKKLNKSSSLYNSQNIIFKKDSQNSGKELYLKDNSINIMNKKPIEYANNKIIFVKTTKNNDAIKNSIQQVESIDAKNDQKINVKRHLFRFGHNYKPEENKINQQSQIEKSQTFFEKEKDNKLNRIMSYKETVIHKKYSGFMDRFNNKSTDKINIENEKEEKKENDNQKGLINHCALNNAGLRKLYKDSYYRKSEKEIIIWKDYNNNNSQKNFFNKNEETPNINNKNINENSSKMKNSNNNCVRNLSTVNSQVKINIHNNNNYSNIINNSNNNNFYHILKKSENQFSSTSMKLIKSNLINNDYYKQQFDSNTYKSKRKTNLNNSIAKNEKEDEEEEDDEIEEEKEEDQTPDDVVLVDCIDKMESIPLNHSIFKTPLLYNNIQQKLKHFLFRGRLPIFKVENYTIQKTLGEGTNGVIYQVINNKTKKPYAMKKLIGNSISELERFQKEFQICHQNPHPYILDIHGVCARCFDSTTYVLYVLMDLAEKDLDSEIADRGKIKKYYKEKELISMLKKLVSALFYLQKEKNVAHRDIKPENILLFKKGKVLKLADFGEAKLNNENRKKTIRGTEFYMSPILYEGNLKSEYVIQHNPFKSDVFSLGYCFILATTLDPQVIKEIRQVKERFKIEQILKKFFQNRYSIKYIQLLLRMISIDENQRVDFIELNKILQNY